MLEPGLRGVVPSGRRRKGDCHVTDDQIGKRTTSIMDKVICVNVSTIHVF